MQKLHTEALAMMGTLIFGRTKVVLSTATMDDQTGKLHVSTTVVTIKAAAGGVVNGQPTFKLWGVTAAGETMAIDPQQVLAAITMGGRLES
jgi:hypothetical protein